MDEPPECEQVEPAPKEEESFRCSFEGCGKTFPSLTILCTHEAVCGKAGVMPRSSCQICGTRAYNMKHHMVLHQPPQHHCPVCLKMFHYRYNLTAHLKIHSKELDPLGEGSHEGTQFLLEMVAAPPRIPKRKLEPESFSCTVCPAVFKSSRNLQFHLNVHNGLTPFTCRNEGCDQAFANHRERYYHERACRGESNKKACQECGLEFPLSSISKHMRRVHQVEARRDRKSAIKDKVYPCGQCSAVLSSERYLISHVNQHKGIKPYPCRNEGCRQSFAWDSKRRLHEKRCRKTASTCPVCGVALANGSVRQDHMAAFHKDDAVLAEMLELECSDDAVISERYQKIDPNELPDGRMKCPECDKIFRKKETFMYHLNMHKGVRPFPCVKCARGFYSKQAHSYHEKKCLAGLKLRRARRTSQIKPPRSVVVEQPEARVEKKTLEEKKPPKPDTGSPPSIKRKRSSKAKAVPKQCELCNKVLQSEKMYERHMAIHNGAGLYRCKLGKDCTETFHTLRDKHVHEAEHHGGDMPEEPAPKERKTYMCEICSAVCYRRKSFRNHMNAHSGIRQLTCRNEGCEETFYSHSARLAHEEPCRGQVSTCPVCDVKLKTKNILRIHMRRKHPDQLPPPANVRVASTTEKKKIYTCTLCSREFRAPKSLREHMNDHTGAKPFQCRNEGCTEKFGRLIARSYHEQACRGLVAPCPFCDMVLKNSFTLKNHVASCHATEKESFDKGIYSYQDQLRMRSELEKNAERVECAEEDDAGGTLDETQIKCEVGDEMQIEWLDDIIEEVDESELLEVKDEVIDHVEEPKSDEISMLDECNSLGNSDMIQVELDGVEIKSEIETEDEDEVDPQTHVEGVLLVEPLKELNTKTIESPMGSKPPLKCRKGNGCQRTFNNAQARAQHENRCKGESLRCLLPGSKPPLKCRNGNGCKRTFNNAQARVQHEPHCRGESFRCPRKGCSYGPTSKLNIEQHLRYNHDEEEAEEDQEKDVVSITVKEEFQVDVGDLEDSSGKKKFKCDVCEAVFCFANSLKYHMNKHTGATPYPCQTPGCGLSFSSPGHRRKHKCQGDVSLLSCSLCSIEFGNQTRLWNHMRTEHGLENPNKEKHVCTVCGESFEYAKTLIIHLNSKHEGAQQFKCRKEGCDKRFRNTHIRNYHETSCGEGGFECPICQVQLATKKILSLHVQRVHENPKEESGSYMCEICSKIFNRGCDLSNHKKVHEPKETDSIDAGNGLVKCGECSKYLKKKNYPYHMNSHRGVRPYACSNCQQGFFSKQAHWYHEKKCLSGKKMRKSPRVYIKFVDTEPKEPIVYDCSVCSQSFPNRHTLFHHKQSHLGPLICTEGCNKSFSRSDLLRKHMREYHGIGEKRVPKVEKTLKCDFCPMMFGFRASLVRHMKLHDDMTRARCPNEACNQTFANDKMLAKHLATCFSDLSMYGEQ